MRTAHLLFFLLFSTPVFCQTAAADSAFAVRQVDSLIQISRKLTANRDFDQAIEVLAPAEKIALEKLGRESAAYGSYCNTLGVVFYSKRNYPEAEKRYHEAMAIRSKVLGKNSPSYAGSLINLGLMYNDTGNYEKAEPLYLEAKEVFEVGLKNREHPFYMNCLTNLANLYRGMGNYENAEPLYLEAKAIREKELGKEHPDYASSLNNLAILYTDMGNYCSNNLVLLVYLRSKKRWQENLYP